MTKKLLGILTIVTVLSISSIAFAEDPVNFPDPNLKVAVEEALGITNPTPTDMLNLSYLHYDNANIMDLTGLETAKNLLQLHLRYNQISDLTPLSGLVKLEYLTLFNNQISSVQPLVGLTQLKELSLNYNQISDLSPLSGLVNLRNLGLANNQINSVSPLTNLTTLTTLYLYRNQIVNIEPLAGCTNLLRLELFDNQIEDISPLSGMINMERLYINGNQIIDISALSGMTNLHDLYLYQNQISDISTLAALTNLGFVNLSSNPLNKEAFCIYIPAVETNNPGITLVYDTPNPYVCAPTYSCSGFQSPLDNGAVKVKKNRVIPVKGQLFDETLMLTDTDITAPPVIQVTYQSTPDADAIDVTEDAYATGLGTDGNTFEYNVGDDVWQFNLKTKNYTATGTYTINMKSGDETEYLVNTCTAQFVIE